MCYERKGGETDTLYRCVWTPGRELDDGTETSESDGIGISSGEN